MPRLFKIIVLGFVFGWELIVVGRYTPYPHGEEFEVRYRQKERIMAFSEYNQHPSPATLAVFQKELRLMHKHEDWKNWLAIGLLITLNAFGAYLFLSWKWPAQKMSIG
jgi:hypothetical protein